MGWLELLTPCGCCDACVITATYQTVGIDRQKTGFRFFVEGEGVPVPVLHIDTAPWDVCELNTSGSATANQFFRTISGTFSQCHAAVLSCDDCSGSIDFSATVDFDGAIAASSAMGTIFNSGGFLAFTGADVVFASAPEEPSIAGVGIGLACGDSKDVSDEYTTDQLKTNGSNDITAIAYATSGLTGSAYYHLTEGDSRIQIGKVAYTLEKNFESAVIHYDRVFTPDDGSDPTIEHLTSSDNVIEEIIPDPSTDAPGVWTIENVVCVKAGEGDDA